MKRTTRVALAALLLAPVTVSATSPAPAGAAPAPTLSASSGAPGTAIEVTSPDCPTGVVDGEPVGFLQATLLVGTAPDEVLAGVGSSGFDEDASTPATLVVPDWVDPTQPATVEATCVTLDPETDELDEVALDPAPFDVLPGVGLPQQTRSFSRTSLLTGQAFEVSLAGCTLPDAVYAEVALVRGDDRSGRNPDGVAYGDGEVLDGSVDLSVILSDASVGYWMSSTGDGDGPPAVEDLGGEEYPNTITAGTYTAFSYCGNEAGTLLFYEPQAIQVTGTSPTGALDLTVPEASRTATLAGTECTTGDVELALEAVSAEDLFEEDLGFDPSETRSRPFTRATPARDGERIVRQAPAARGRSARALGDDGFVEATVSPVDGSWSLTDGAGFDQGLVFGYATCGDPLADGFAYDPQVAEVDVPAPVPVPTTPVTVVTPAPLPAQGVAGTPTYAG